MTLTNALSRPTAAITAILSAVALLIALVGAGNQPARADKFTPLEDPPTISIETNAVVVTPSGTLDDAMDPTVSAADTTYDDFNAFQPAFDGSNEIYNVFATITSNADDWQENITRVRLCIYEPAAIGALDEPNDDVDVVCGFDLGGLGAFEADLGDLPHEDPSDILVIEWNKTDYDDGDDMTGFTVLDNATNKHANAGSEAAFLAATTNTGLIRFSFRVSHAMQESDDWEIRVAVESQPPSFDADGEECEDPGTGTCAAENPQSGTDISGTVDIPSKYPVAYFGSMTAARATTVNFGVVRFAEVVTRAEISSGSYVANAVSSVIIQASAFSNGSGGAEVTVPLATTGDLFNSSRNTDQDGDTTTWAPDNRVSLDCKYDATESLNLNTIRAGASPDYASWLQVGNFARVFATGKAATPEAAETLTAHACALTYGGGAGRANVVFSNQVDIGIMKSIEGASATFGDDVDFPAQLGGDVNIAANNRPMD